MGTAMIKVSTGRRMSPLLTLILLLILSPSQSTRSVCPTHSQLQSLVKDPRDRCTCDPDNFTGGFDIECVNSSGNSTNYGHFGDFTITPHFSIKLAENRAILVNCDDYVPDFKPAMFQAFGVDDVETFNFKNCPLPSLPLSVILHRTSVKVAHVADGSSSSEEDKKKMSSSTPTRIQKDVVSEVKSLRIEFSQPQRHPVNYLKSMLNGLDSLENLMLVNVAIELPSSGVTNNHFNNNNNNFNNHRDFVGPSNNNGHRSLTGPARVFFSRVRRSAAPQQGGRASTSFTPFSPMTSFSTSSSSSSSSSFTPMNSEAIIRSRLRLRPVDRPPDLAQSSPSSTPSTISTTPRRPVSVVPLVDSSSFSRPSAGTTRHPSSGSSSPSFLAHGESRIIRPPTVLPPPLSTTTSPSTTSSTDDLEVGETTTVSAITTTATSTTTSFVSRHPASGNNNSNNRGPSSVTTTTNTPPVSVHSTVSSSRTGAEVNKQQAAHNTPPVVTSSAFSLSTAQTSPPQQQPPLSIQPPSLSASSSSPSASSSPSLLSSSASTIPSPSPSLFSTSRVNPPLGSGVTSHPSPILPLSTPVTTTVSDPVSAEESSLLASSNNNVQSLISLLNLSLLTPKLKSLLLETFFTVDSVSNSFLLKGMCRELKQLEVVQLRNNQLPIFADETFKEASSLKRLFLVGNAIRKIQPRAFIGLKELQILDLSSNNLTSLPEDIFQDLSSLVRLGLGKNNFNQLPPRLLRHTRHLKALNLSQSRNLTSLPPTFLSDTRELTNFTMTDTFLTDISQAPTDFFSLLPSLEKVEMRGGKLRNLTAVGLFGRNPSLRKIDLSYNDIQFISSAIFSSNSSSIQELNLYGNELFTIEEGTFDYLKGLKILKLGFNNIHTLMLDKLLVPLKKLEEIDLSKNKLSTVNPSMTTLPFGFGANLRKINFYHNNISDFTEFNAVDWSLYLKIAEINLSSNRVRSTVQLPIFHSTAEQIILDLKDNAIESIDVTEILHYEALVVRASREGILSDEDDDNGRGKRRRASSSPASQVIVRIDNNPFRCDCHLEPFITYAKRSSSDFDAAFLETSSRVSFSMQDLKCISPSKLAGRSVSQVNVQDLTCRITSPNLCPSECTCEWRSVDRHALINCQKNGLKYIPESIVSPSHYRNMTLETPQPNNGVTSSSRTGNRRPTPSSEVITVDAEVVTLLLNNNLISDVDSLSPILYPSPTDFVIPSSASHLLSSSSLLTPVEPLSFHLYLDNNRIRDLPQKILSSADNNSHLGVVVGMVDGNGNTESSSSSSGEHIQQQWMTPSSMVTVLSLRNNELTRLPLNFLQMFGHEGSSSNGGSNDTSPLSPRQRRQLFLGNNPYNCSPSNQEESCQFVEVKAWLTKNSDIVRDVKDISCKFPETGEEKPLLDMQDTELCPQLLQSNSGILFLSIVCLVFSVILVLFCVTYYRNKQTILAFVYIHINPIFVCLNFSEDDLDEDKQYDAFVSYSSSDRDIVMEMIEKLETPSDQSIHSISFLKQQSGMPSIHEGNSDQIVPEHSVHMGKSPSHQPVPTNKSGGGENVKDKMKESSEYYTLCIHERDWLPGNLISWNIVNSVQNSRRTILILSKEFIRSIWFQVEFHTAYYQMLEDKMDRLIVVVKGELPPKEEMDKDLVFLLTTKTYLTWGEKWFWEKLRYALPHKKAKGVQMPLLKGKTSSSPSSGGKQSKADIMREYVDQTISDHFQLRAKTRPTNHSNDSSKRRKNGVTPQIPTPTSEQKGVYNESFVLETET